MRFCKAFLMRILIVGLLSDIILWESTVHTSGFLLSSVQHSGCSNSIVGYVCCLLNPPSRLLTRIWTSPWTVSSLYLMACVPLLMIWLVLPGHCWLEREHRQGAAAPCCRFLSQQSQFLTSAEWLSFMLRGIISRSHHDNHLLSGNPFFYLF